MKTSILRACAIACVAMALFATAKLVDFSFFCHEATWPRRMAAAGEALPSDGFAVARPDEALVVCSNTHCFGPPALPLWCHDDRACYCAGRAAADDADEITRRFASTRRDVRGCVLDKRDPRRDDARPVCPGARCAAHID
jgi:hypothetical protein